MLSSAAAANRRSAEFLREHGFGRFGAEIAQIDDERVDLRPFQFFERGEHVLFVFHDDGAVIQPFAVFFDDAFFSLFGESDGKTVARNRDDADLDFGQF